MARKNVIKNILSFCGAVRSNHVPSLTGKTDSQWSLGGGEVFVKALQKNDSPSIFVRRGRRVYYGGYFTDVCYAGLKKGTKITLDDVDESTLEGIEERPCAVFVNIKGKEVLVTCADEDMSGLDSVTIDGCPAVSFACIARLLDIDEHDIMERVASGSVRFVDVTKDSYIKYEGSEPVPANFDALKKLRQKIGTKHPGYTLIIQNNKLVWHRPASALVAYKSKFYLVGQDENTYFGVELPTKPQTLEEAYTDLTPVEARNIPGTVRQGEWFVVPVDRDSVPEDYECSVFAPYPGTIGLPIDDMDSNIHEVQCSSYKLTKSGVLYAMNPEISHDEHERVAHTGWAKILKNTALQSVSQQGVD